MKKGELDAEPELTMSKHVDDGTSIPTFDDESEDEEDEAVKSMPNEPRDEAPSIRKKPSSKSKTKKRRVVGSEEKPNLTLEGDDFFGSD